jgi:isopentenyl-diphosphate Delta-isomerase
MQKVVLVDDKDNILGEMEILKAHAGSGTLHRAVSVLVYRKTKGVIELLLQKRSSQKPLWPLYWSNTICTHPKLAESYPECAVRRLYEEMGIKVPASDLQFIFKLNYHAKYNELLSENELDGVFVAKWNGKLKINPEEVAESRFTSLIEVQVDIKNNADIYTPWFIKLMQNKRLIDALI